MVLSLNRREVLEANNFWISENRLPDKFIVPLSGKDDPIVQQLIKLFERTAESDLEFIDKFKQHASVLDPVKEYEVYVYERSSPGASIREVGQYTSDRKNYAKITVEEFNRMILFDQVPLMTENDVLVWLKYEKGIIINNTKK